MTGLSGILLILLTIQRGWSKSVDYYNEGASCYDCQYAAQGQTPNEHGDWLVNNYYSGFHRCALENEGDAHYVNKWSCVSERCFIRKDPNGQIYRGCADQWNLPWGIDTNLNCSRQGRSAAVWWFCDGHLCNDGFLHDAARCGDLEPETKAPPFYYEEPHEDVREPVEYPTEIYEETRTTENKVEEHITVGTTTKRSIEPSTERQEVVEYQPPEYTIDEETVHGIGFYDNFRDVEETRPMAPIRPQNDPKNIAHSHVTHSVETQHQGKIPDHGQVSHAKHHPKSHDHKGYHPVDQKPRIYDHGGLYPTNERPEIHDRGFGPQGNEKETIPKQAKPGYGVHKDHSAEPFWMWWWHSGAYQRMTPQEAYLGYLNQRAQPIQPQHSAGGDKDSVSEKEKSISRYQRQWHPGQRHQLPYQSRHDYAPIRSNVYYSRINNKRRQSSGQRTQAPVEHHESNTKTWKPQAKVVHPKNAGKTWTTSAPVVHHHESGKSLKPKPPTKTHHKSTKSWKPQAPAENKDAQAKNQHERVKSWKPLTPVVHHHENAKSWKPPAPVVRQHESVKSWKPQAPVKKQHESIKSWKPKAPVVHYHENTKSWRPQTPAANKHENDKSWKPKAPVVHHHASTKSWKPQAPVENQHDSLKSWKPQAPIVHEHESVKSWKPQAPTENQHKSVKSWKPQAPVVHEHEGVKSWKPQAPGVHEHESVKSWKPQAPTENQHKSVKSWKPQAPVVHEHESVKSWKPQAPTENQHKSVKSWKPQAPVVHEHESVKSWKPQTPTENQHRRVKSWKPQAPTENQHESVKSWKPQVPVVHEHESVKSWKPQAPTENQHESVKSWKPQAPVEDKHNNAKSWKSYEPVVYKQHTAKTWKTDESIDHHKDSKSWNREAHPKDTHRRMYSSKTAIGAKSIDPLDYRSFKPPHTHSIVEPIGPVPEGYAYGEGAGYEERQEQGYKVEPLLPVLDHQEKAEDGGKVKSEALSKKSFYEYYENLKLSKHDGPARGHIAAKDDYNPCTTTCFENPGALHKVPGRADGFIQCGPGRQNGEPCKCCQPYYHMCPEGTTFDEGNKGCNQAGSSTVEDRLYKTLDLYEDY